MAKVWIDCGARNGQTSKVFRQLNPSFEMYLIEANPFIKPNIDNAVWIKQVAWDKDGVVEFYIHKKKMTDDSSTAIRKKQHPYVDKKHPLYLPSFDVSGWMSRSFDKSDKIVLEMDIEGSEYKVLPKMIETGTISLVSVIYVEWHYKRCGISKAKHNDLVKRLVDCVPVVKDEYLYHKDVIDD